jgi:ABC-type lipoprotein release transport system permease subunit
MLLLAWRHVRRHPRRFAACAAAIASSVVLVCVAAGLYGGLLGSVSAYPDSLPGDFVVAQAGSAAQLSHSSSVISPDTERAVRALPGVARVEALYGYMGWLERDGRQAIVFLVGLGPGDRFGRPQRIVAGRRKPKLFEIIVDRTLAHDLRVGIGDRLQLGDASLPVVGISDGGNAVLASYAFVHKGALALAGRTRPSYLFVTAEPGTARDLAGHLAAVPGARVFTRPEFHAMNQGLTRQLVLPLVSITITLSALVTGIVVASTLYTATVERRADWGLMAAIGVPSRNVEGQVLAQGVLVGVAGTAAGLLATAALTYAIPAIEPRLAVATPAWVLTITALGALAIGLVAAWGPTRAAAAVDPAEAFRV